MWSMKKKFLFLCYRIKVSWLPVSRRSALSRKLRSFGARRIIDYCGNNVNIEKNAVFSLEP